MTNSISPLFSSLYTTTLDDWITGLGEKALVAWLRFHSWNAGQVSPKKPFLLPLSLNKIIQRLKIGKATFYKKILQPLLDYGLIQLQPAPDTPRELHLLVYAFPEQIPNQRAESSPTTTCSNDTPSIENPSSHPSSPKWQNEEMTSPELPSDPTAQHPFSEPTYLPDLQPIPSVSNGTSSTTTDTGMNHDNPSKKIHPRLSHSIHSLPTELQQVIMRDPRLIERKDDIIQAYHECREHPSFNDADFQQKMQSCIAYPHDKLRFGTYLRKALLNEWHKSSSPSVKKSSPTSQRPCPKDVPEWVFQQQERERMNVPHQSEELNPDQQAEINRLLKELGEI